MECYVFIHLKGQFFHSNPGPRVQLLLSERLLVSVSHVITYSLNTANNDLEQSCHPEKHYSLDNCIVEVILVFNFVKLK